MPPQTMSDRIHSNRPQHHQHVATAAADAATSDDALAVAAPLMGGQQRHLTLSHLHLSPHQQHQGCAPVNANHQRQDEEESRRCRHCHSKSLRIDWSQGDRVCTNCGVVDEQHVRDDGPEWRDYEEDRVNGLRPATERSGLVPNDDQKYLGGLQPTGLSKNVFGKAKSRKEEAIGPKLVSANRKADHLVTQIHKEGLRRARLSLKARMRRKAKGLQHAVDGDADEDDFGSVRPEHDAIVMKEQMERDATTATTTSYAGSKEPDEAARQKLAAQQTVLLLEEGEEVHDEAERAMLQAEEDAARAHAILQRDKWSLDRALLLHGQDHEHAGTDRTAQKNDLQSRMDPKLRKASFDLYQAYRMLQESAKRLQLPEAVASDATETLCEYARNRDGFLVRGVATRLGTSTKLQRKEEAMQRLREYNTLRQMAALGSALLYLTSRKHDCPRLLKDVCGSFRNPAQPNDTSAFIKSKHTSKAMNELKVEFPDFYRSAGTYVSTNTDGYVEHAIHKLALPPVATACVRELVKHCKSQPEMGMDSDKVTTICAAVSYFVCMVGDILQRLARQSHQYSTGNTGTGTATPILQLKQEDDSNASSDSSTNGDSGKSKSVAQTKQADHDSKKKKNKNTTPTTTEQQQQQQQQQKNQKQSKKRKRFDVFSHDAIALSQAEKKRYEMRRIWDAWSEQTTWSRPLTHIEQSCGVSRSVVLESFRTKLFPQRERLLSELQQSVKQDGKLRETPLAQSLLSNVSAAAPLMVVPDER